MKRNSRKFLKGRSIAALKKSSQFSWELHSHDYFELILYEDCEGFCTVNEVQYPVSPSCLFLLTPFDFHKIDIKDAPHCRSFVVSFTDDAVDSELLLPLSLSAHIYYDPSPYIAASIEELHDTLRYRPLLPYSDKQATHLLNGVLARVLQSGVKVSKTAAGFSPAIHRAMLYAMSSYGQELTLADMAKRCHMSPAYFSMLFHKETGKPFTKWLNEVRIDRAKGFLLATDDTVLKIMSQCGYNTPSHFIKCFRAETGMTPSEYRAAKRIEKR